MSGRRVVWLAVAAFALLSWWSCERGERRLRANLVLGIVETRGAQLAAQGSQVADPLRPTVAANIQALRRVLPDAPADARLALAIGSHYLLLGNFTDAAEWYDRALALEPRPEIYLNLGRAAYLAGDRDSAVENFRKAVEIDVTLRRSVPEALRDEMPERQLPPGHESARRPR